MKQYRALIVEDEKPARERLKRLLKNHQQSIDIIGEAANGEEGVQLIEKLNPEIVFLDIQMPGKTGFEVLQSITNKPFIIFTTAYDEYALKAFETNSIDYLLKPIEKERLAKAIDKLQQLAGEPNIDAALIRSLAEKLGTPQQMTSLTIKVGDRIHILKLDNIQYLEARDKYVFAIDQEGKEHLLNQTLNELDNKLPDIFLRINRSVIINQEQQAEIHKYFKGRLKFVMPDGNEFISGDSYKESIRQAFDL